MRRRHANLGRRYSQFRRLRGTPTFWFVVLICFIVGVGVGWSWQKVRLINMGYEFRRLSLQESVLARSNAEYEDEVAKLEAPDRIEAIAREQLRMVRPQSWQLVSIRMENPVPPPKPDEEPPLPETRESTKGFSFMARLLD